MYVGRSVRPVGGESDRRLISDALLTVCFVSLFATALFVLQLIFDPEDLGF